MHIVSVYAWYLPLWIPQHLPSVDNMILRNITLFGNLANSFLHVIARFFGAVCTIYYPVLFVVYTIIIFQCVIARRDGHHKKYHWSRRQILDILD